MMSKMKAGGGVMSKMEAGGGVMKMGAVKTAIVTGKQIGRAHV